MESYVLFVLFKGGSWPIEYPLCTGVFSWDSAEGEPFYRFRLQAGIYWSYLKIGIPDYFFAVADNCISQMVGRLKWLPLLVLCFKLCPPGIQGTFYTLLMSLQNAGLLMSAWWGGLLLHMLNVTRTEFSNLWVVILIRNISRLLPLMLLFLVPQSDHNSTLLPLEMLQDSESTETGKSGSDSLEFSVLVADDSSCLSSDMLVENERVKSFDDGDDDIELIPLVNKS